MNISQRSFYYFLTLLISLILQINSEKQITQLIGDEIDNQIKLSSNPNSDSKLFLVFYVKHCIYCSHVLTVLKDQIIKNFEDEEEITFGIINLDNQNNVWSGLRFNITKIPYIILIEKNRMYYYQNSFDENSVMKFITGEKNEEDALNIPPAITFFIKFKAVMKELSQKVEVIFGKYGLKKEFAGKITYAFVFIGLIVFLYIESKIIFFCSDLCNKKQKPKDKKENIIKKEEIDNEKLKKE